jgi:hypothetical protein
MQDAEQEQGTRGEDAQQKRPKVEREFMLTEIFYIFFIIPSVGINVILPPGPCFVTLSSMFSFFQKQCVIVSMLVLCSIHKKGKSHLKGRSHQFRSAWKWYG